MSRRCKGEGSYYHDEKARLWRWRINYTDKLTGESHVKVLYNSDKAKLKAEIQAFQAKLAAGTTKDPTVAEWCSIWLNTIVEPSCKEKTKQNYKATAKNHILPTFGKYHLSQVTPIMLQDYFNSLLLDRSPITVISVRTIFIVFFSSAIDYGYCINNPAKSTRPPKKPKTRRKALFSGEIERLGIIIRDEVESALSDAGKYLKRVYEEAVHLAISTGMREGEIFGLTWDNLDLNNHKLFVKLTLSPAKGKAKFDTPKTTGSERQIILANSTVERLKAWKIEQEQYAERYYGIFNNANNLVFTNIEGGFVSMTNFYHRFWQPVLEKAGIDCVFHDLRHTHGSMLLAAGVDVQVVSHRLGHASVSTTMDIYAHELPDQQLMAQDKINTIF